MTNEMRQPPTPAAVEIDPPTFSPPRDMRAGYLEHRLAELEMMLICAREDDWKPVVNVVNHVRGTGAMYGFGNIGDAAENLMRAIQNGDPSCRDLLATYVDVVRQSYV